MAGGLDYLIFTGASLTINGIVWYRAARRHGKDDVERIRRSLSISTILQQSLWVWLMWGALTTNYRNYGACSGAPATNSTDSSSSSSSTTTTTTTTTTTAPGFTTHPYDPPTLHGSPGLILASLFLFHLLLLNFLMTFYLIYMRHVKIKSSPDETDSFLLKYYPHIKTVVYVFNALATACYPVPCTEACMSPEDNPNCVQGLTEVGSSSIGAELIVATVMGVVAVFGMCGGNVGVGAVAGLGFFITGLVGGISGLVHKWKNEWRTPSLFNLTFTNVNFAFWQADANMNSLVGGVFIFSWMQLAIEYGPEIYASFKENSVSPA